MSAPDDDDLETQLHHERDHLAAAHSALRDMRVRAQQLYDLAEVSSGDGYTAERLGVTLRQRVAELADVPDAPLFFGRLDFGAGAGLSADDGTRHYIGRRHVVDQRGLPMVLDWRAPVSRAFYRASAADPQAVEIRRRFGFQAGELTSFEDEHLTHGEELGTRSSILTEEIERPRVGPMRDIVATIQPDQDELVRADLSTSVCVQGAPGTGKTAVGLHRAAYLLYAHRERLRRSKVLIVGPSRALLAYISSVLPALGEIDVDQVSLDELVARLPVRATDSSAAALVKHDGRLAQVLERAIWSGVAGPGTPISTRIELPDGARLWRLDPDVQRRLVAEVRAERPAYALGRERLRARVVAALARRAEASTGAATSESWLKRAERNRSVNAFVDEVWPALTPQQLVAGLFGDREALARAADGLLTDAEQDVVSWARAPRSPGAARWSAADQWVLDEAAGLIERPGEYGHVVIDEAQDLSPMQLRALARRSAHGSVTVLGDLAQGTSPWAARSWQDTLSLLGKPDAGVVPLTTGFRVPKVVMDFANRLMPSLAVDVPAGESLRTDGSLAVRGLDDAADLLEAVVAECRRALAEEGSVGLIVPDALTGPVARELARAVLPFTALAADPVDGQVEGKDEPDDEPAARISLVPATLAKGLEYDHVIVVEPAAIARAETRGLNRLYVVLTRAVSRLVVLHAEPLPAVLAA